MALEGHVKVQTEALSQKATEVKEQIRQIETDFEKLKKWIDGTANFWTGEAGEYHRNQYQSKVEQIEGILLNYREQVKDLEQMAGVYEVVEPGNEQIEESLPVSDLDDTK